MGSKVRSKQPHKAMQPATKFLLAALLVLALSLFIAAFAWRSNMWSAGTTAVPAGAPLHGSNDSPSRAGILGPCSEFACDFLVALRPLNHHILRLPSAQRYRPTALPSTPQYKRLLSFDTSLPPDALGGMAEQAHRVDAHFATLLRDGKLGPHRGYVADVLSSKSHSTLNLRFYNIFSLNTPAVAPLYWAVKRAFHHYRVANGMPSQIYMVHGASSRRRHIHALPAVPLPHMLPDSSLLTA
jgi:hypothetical protein